MTVSPGRFLALLAFFILLSGPAQAGLPKILVLPPDPVTNIDRKVQEEFQWVLAKALDNSGYFDIVTKKKYENYLKEHDLTGANAIPDSVVLQMMENLQATILARATISQPNGKGTKFLARVAYIFPKYDYKIDGEQYSVENEKKCWDLAYECIRVIVSARKRINLMLIARSYYDYSYYDKALEYYRQLVNLEPKNPTFHYMAAMSFMKMSQYAEAVAEFKEILVNIDPRHVPTLETLADYYFANSDFEGALRHFIKLVEIDPENYSYIKYRAFTLDKLERPDEAIELYEKLIGIKDDDAAVRQQMASYYYNKAGELETAGNSAAAKPLARKAIEYMTRSCEISCSAGDSANPDWLKIHCQRLNFLAMLQLEFKDTGKAIATLQKIVELDPAFPGAFYNLGVYAHKAKNFEKAIDYYIKALNYADDAQKAALNYEIGVIYFTQFKKYPQAITALTTALETNDANERAMVYYLRGIAYYDYANELDYATDGVADIDALIDSGTMSHARADRALELYTNSLADFRKVTTGDPKAVRSARQYIDKIARLTERLVRIKRQIDYREKTR